MNKLIVTILLLACCFCYGDRRRAQYRQAPASGGGSFNPTNVADLIFWLDTDALSGSDGDAVQTFPDAWNDYDFSHATSGNRPLLTNSTPTLGNKKTLWFDGSNDFLTNKTYQTAAQNYTFYGVLKFKDAYNNFNGGYILATAANMDIRPNDAGVFKLTVFDGTANREFAAIADAEPRVISVVMNSTGTALNVYTNGISMGAATAWVQPSAGGYFTMAANYTESTAFINGILGDQLLYTGAHGTTDRQNIEDYLGAKFGITINH